MPRTASPAHSELVTVDGQIIGVDRTPTEDKLSYGVRITVRAEDSKNVSIELAPGWWLDEQGLRFVPMDRIEVIGARSPEARQRVVAWEVHAPDRSLRLRDTNGQPLWPARPAP